MIYSALGGNLEATAAWFRARGAVVDVGPGWMRAWLPNSRPARPEAPEADLVEPRRDPLR
ncbi:MAG: hypothetical protein ABMB14_20685 [Myxococcota bacterium]